MKPGLRAQLISRLGPRLILLVAITISAVAVISTGARVSILPPPPAHAPLPPKVASYVGVFEEGVPPGYEPVAAFARATRKHPNLVGYYSGWAEPFASSFAERMHKHGAIPYVQIDPTLASVSAIANGRYDIYLRTYADSVRDFAHAVVIGFGHEMNAPWYSWGYTHVSPATFVAAWRHIVTVFRHEGADNVTWLWTVTGRPRHRADQVLVAGREVRHVGGHRRLLLPALRHVHQRLRPYHRQCAEVHRQARAAVRDRRRAGSRPVPQDRQSVPRDAQVPHARAGVVRHPPERRLPPPELAP